MINIISDFFIKIWLYVNKYWQIILLFVGMIVTYFILRRNELNFSEQLQEINSNYLKQLNSLKEIREKEQVSLEKNEHLYEERIIEIKEQYEKNIEVLDKQTQANIDSIIKQYGDKPEVLAAQLSQSLGFTVKVNK